MGVVNRNFKSEFKELCFKINQVSGSVQIQNSFKNYILNLMDLEHQKNVEKSSLLFF